MIEIPCTPHFISSLAFPCRHAGEDVEGIVAKIPFFLFESYIVTPTLILFTFYSLNVFLGLAWMRREFSKLRLNPTIDGFELGSLTEEYLEEIFTEYRTCRRSNNLLSESFRLYLEWFPSVPIFQIAVLVFATLRIYDIPIHVYLLFPACSLRCIVEALAPLAMAGKANQGSICVLQEW